MLVKEPTPDKVQVTPELVESLATVAVMLSVAPALMVCGALGARLTVIGTPEGVPLPPHATKKTKLPTIETIDKLRTAASSDIGPTTELHSR
jgi:hypothetical protein